MVCIGIVLICTFVLLWATMTDICVEKFSLSMDVTTATPYYHYPSYAQMVTKNAKRLVPMKKKKQV